MQCAQDGATGWTEPADGSVSCSHQRGQTVCSVQGGKIFKGGISYKVPLGECVLCIPISLGSYDRCTCSAWGNKKKWVSVI